MLLVVFQFAISIMLIFGTVVIYSQLNYIRHKDIGFNRNQILQSINTNCIGRDRQPLLEMNYCR